MNIVKFISIFPYFEQRIPRNCTNVTPYIDILKLCVKFYTKRIEVVSCEKIVYNFVFPPPQNLLWSFFVEKHLHMPLHTNIQVKQYFSTRKTKIENQGNKHFQRWTWPYVSFVCLIPTIQRYIHDGSKLKRSPSFPVSSLRSFPFENHLWFQHSFVLENDGFTLKLFISIIT